MGTWPDAAYSSLSHGASRGAGTCAGISGGGGGEGFCTHRRHRHQQAPRRAGRRQQVSGPRKDQAMSDEDTTRAGFCAVIGAPNAGKSTLVNQLTGSKVAIVSHKVQTTRARLRAIVMEGKAQIVLVDTPGIFKPKRKLDEAMVESAWGGAGEADAVLLLVDGRGSLSEDVQRIIEGLKSS